jgi:outer membrane protein OmpA-like peptidoglycan-associated protein
MSGLMIVFLFIAIIYMLDSQETTKAAIEDKTQAESDRTQAELLKGKAEKLQAQSEDLAKQLALEKEKLRKEGEVVREIAAAFNGTQKQLWTDLNSEFENDLERWNAEIDKDSTIRFKAPETLFQEGEDTILPLFEERLKEFFPRYVRVLFGDKYRDEISEIRIEGHTNSNWTDGASQVRSYLGNMNLSQQRALRVLEHCFSQDEVTTHRGWLINNLRANGLSYSRPLPGPDRANEDKALSRRVEFRVLTKSEEKMLKIIEEISADEK